LDSTPITPLQRTLPQWLDYLESIHPADIALGLDRVREIVQRGHWGSLGCPVITVAGTNGKGSCIALMEAMLLQAGNRVAAYTSPQLHHFSERLRIHGQPVQSAQLCEAFEQVEQIRESISLTFFEFTTIAALSIMQSTPLDIVLLEVGLGGRLDAVNVIDPDIAVITTIDLDHMDYLGNTREAIAFEKAGILRQGKPLICAESNPPESLIKQVQALAVDYHDVSACALSKTAAFLPHLSAACALKVMRLLKDSHPVTEQVIAFALANTRLPGRFEQVVNATCPTWLDVAHNPQAARLLAGRLAALTQPQGRWHAVVGMLSNKDIPGTLAPLLSYIDQWHLASLSTTPRGGSAQMLDDALEKISGTDPENRLSYQSVQDAYQGALLHAGEQDRIIVFGSFYTVALIQD
jgi:dihydrofolate synthase/folylpolyglutamate synthase